MRENPNPGAVSSVLGSYVSSLEYQFNEKLKKLDQLKQQLDSGRLPGSKIPNKSKEMRSIKNEGFYNYY